MNIPQEALESLKKRARETGKTMYIYYYINQGFGIKEHYWDDWLAKCEPDGTVTIASD